MKKLSKILMTIGVILLFVTVFEILRIKGSNLYLIVMAFMGCISYYSGLICGYKATIQEYEKNHDTPKDYIKKHRKDCLKRKIGG
ncbi:hypothetical protein [Anaerosacchariphilus polymeriproducens]|uniref:Uncharacterized protein n=1 Tax=Anaerosacchariphilus polymeriproducens TaxID=1812858 RepID=A0A371AUF1_9FIRM|nr:hypothetical protein [Anaerosacchariphilus polymeriproducens]RDU23181.1 hypothetical protein DWV06_10800 [Anaerosacchariphilus polymeriproducens]